MGELVVLTQGDVLAEVQGQVGLITLNRAKALNALSLDMVRSITKVLSAWQHDPRVQAVAMRGMGKEGAFGAFCAGGDIRFFIKLLWRVTLGWKISSPKNTGLII